MYVQNKLYKVNHEILLINSKKGMEMEHNELLEEIAFEEELLSEEFDKLIDEDLLEFENSLLGEESMEEAELNLELLQDESAIDLGEMDILSFEKVDTSPLDDMIRVLKKHPDLKITLSL